MPDPVTESPAAVSPAAVAGPPLATPPPAAAAGTPAAPSASPKDPPAAPQSAPGTTKTELEIKLPDGLKADATLLGKFKSIATEHGLTSKQAQALVDFNLAASKEAADRDAKAWEQQKQTWTEELKADKDFGGQNYDKNLDLANKAIRQFGGDAAVKRFNDLGVAYDPTFVKFMSSVGKAIADDKLDVGTPNGSTDNSREGQLRAMFPNSPQMFEKGAMQPHLVPVAPPP